jgi:hypothetical protein
MDLASIHWVITGGESGATTTVREFPIECGTAIHESGSVVISGLLSGDPHRAVGVMQQVARRAA